MVIKIFTKRMPGGDYINTGLQYKEVIIEADKVMLTPTDTGFDFTTVLGDKSETGCVHTHSQGYEIRNNAGVVIDRYVTALTERQISENTPKVSA